MFDLEVTIVVVLHTIRCLNISMYSDEEFCLAIIRFDIDSLWQHHQVHSFQRITHPVTVSTLSMNQGSIRKSSANYSLFHTITKLCDVWEVHFLPHDTTCCNCSSKVKSRIITFNWLLIHGFTWSGVLKMSLFILFLGFAVAHHLSAASINFRIMSLALFADLLQVFSHA